MSDVTKDLLIKISTEGGDSTASELKKSSSVVDGILGKTLGLNAAWELFNKLVGLAKTGLTAAANAFGGMVDISSRFEQLGIRFDTIFGANGPAQSALDWATEFAARTPLTLEQVTSAMLRLKAYGFDPMTGSLESIGNAVFALGGDFNSVVLALGQMEIRGKVVQQELNQLTNQNIPAVRWLKDELGLTAAQMGDIGNQAVSSSAAIEVILRKFDELYGGSLKRAGDTWVGAVTTIKDTWTLFIRDVMDAGPFDFLVENIKAVRDVFSEITGSAAGRSFAENVGRTVTGYLNDWRGIIIEELNPGTGSIYNALVKSAIILKEVLGTTKDIAMAASPITTVFGWLLDATALWALGWGIVRMKIKEVFETIQYHATSAALWLQGLWDSVYTGGATMINKLETYFIDFMQRLLDPSGGKWLFFLERYGLDLGALDKARSFFEDAQTQAAQRKLLIESTIADNAASLAKSNAMFENYLVTGTFALNEFSGAVSKNMGETAKAITLFSADLGLGASPDKRAYDESVVPIIYSADAVRPAVNERLPSGSLGGNPYAMSSGQGTTGWNPGDPAGIVGANKPIQLLPPPGDDLMTMFVDYINRSMRAEGTIGAGF